MFPNSYIRRIYNYIKLNDGENILIYEMSARLMISQPTIRKYLKWLERRELIRREKKRIWTNPI